MRMRAHPHPEAHQHTHTSLQFFKDLNSEPKDQKQLLALKKALGKGEAYNGDLPGRLFKEFEKLFNEVQYPPRPRKNTHVHKHARARTHAQTHLHARTHLCVPTPPRTNRATAWR